MVGYAEDQYLGTSVLNPSAESPLKRKAKKKPKKKKSKRKSPFTKKMSREFWGT